MTERTRTFCERLIMLVATTGCIIAVLLVMATTPSQDELVKGGVAGVAANLLAPLVRRLSTGASDG